MCREIHGAANRYQSMLQYISVGDFFELSISEPRKVRVSLCSSTSRADDGFGPCCVLEPNLVDSSVQYYWRQNTDSVLQ